MPERKEGYAPVQPLHVRLCVASQRDAAVLEEAVTASHAPVVPDSDPK